MFDSPSYRLLTPKETLSETKVISTLRRKNLARCNQFPGKKIVGLARISKWSSTRYKRQWLWQRCFCQFWQQKTANYLECMLKVERQELAKCREKLNKTSEKNAGNTTACGNCHLRLRHTEKSSEFSPSSLLTRVVLRQNMAATK